MLALIKTPTVISVKDLYSPVPADQLPPGTKLGIRGVPIGVTRVSSVLGKDASGSNVDGQLFYRGVEFRDVVRQCMGLPMAYERVSELLLTGVMGDMARSGYSRAFPPEKAHGMALTVLEVMSGSSDIMATLAAAMTVISGFSPQISDFESNYVVGRTLISAFPVYVVKAMTGQTLYPLENESTAEYFLRAVRPQTQATPQEIAAFDLCLVALAEHGGGNNSTFTVRSAASVQSKLPTAIANGIGSLAGPLHGGANGFVTTMMNELSGMDNQAIETRLREKLGRKEKLYGFGHAVYTVSDPRAVELQQVAKNLANHLGVQADFESYLQVAQIVPQLLKAEKGKDFPANVDFWSAFIFKHLGIAPEHCPAIFAMSRVTGWVCHYLEEIHSKNPIIRPSYKLPVDTAVRN